MHSQTLEYENPLFLQSLFANDFRLLRLLNDAFGVRVTTRDGWVKCEGEKPSVEKAVSVFKHLEKIRRKGGEITEHAFRFALSRFSEGSQQEPLTEMMETRLEVSKNQPAITPRTEGQVEYLKALAENDIVFGIGAAGTGKTYLAMAKALSLLKNKEIKRIILTRPAVEAGEALGFLPGDLKEKIFPYLRPLYDALYSMLSREEIEKYIETGQIEIAPLAYMRGRTLDRAFVILDEAQNTTCEQMFMFLTRIGTESRAVVTGDGSQIDLKGNVRSGLLEAMSALGKVRGICFVKFKETDVVRHQLVKRIIEAYADHRGE